MIDLTSHLASIGDDVKRLQELARKAIERETDPGLREHLKQLDEMMTQSFDKVKETLPAAEAQLNQDIKGISESAARTEKEIAATRGQLAEATAQAAAGPPVAVPVPFDPNLGAQLRDELLDRFAPRQAEPQPGLQDFSVEFDAASHEVAAAPAGVVPVGAALASSVVSGMLIFARVAKNDVIYHPACGDGRLLISAASRFQASGVGLEGDPALVQQALENIRKARLKGLVDVKQADVMTADYAPASIVFLTMAAAANASLIGAIRPRLRPGARIVAYAQPIPDWPPLAETTIRDEKGNPHRLYIWIVDNAAAGSVTSITSWEWDKD